MRNSEHPIAVDGSAAGDAEAEGAVVQAAPGVQGPFQLLARLFGAHLFLRDGRAGRTAHLAAGPERDLLCEEVVEAWLPMAHRIATRFRNKGESLDDLKQIAAMGLLKAVQRFDPERGAFEAYAVPTITGELRRRFRDHLWDVHVPRSVQELRNDTLGISQMHVSRLIQRSCARVREEAEQHQAAA